MIKAFKIWISSLLCLGIFVTFIELVMPNSKFKKYIYSLVGIIAIITIISPIVNLYKNGDIESSVNKVISAMSKSISDNTIDTNNISTASQEELVKNQFIEKLKKDVSDKLTLKGIDVENVNISIDDQYNITKININIKKLNSKVATIDNVNSVVSYINEQYDIDYSKIYVTEKGG